MIHPGFTLQPISPGGTYEGPVPGQNQTCHCTSIFYSLISACSACQDGSWIRCVQFNVAYMRISRAYLLCQLDTIPPKLLNQCLLNSVSSTIAVMQALCKKLYRYPAVIPRDTSVPHWAYLNVSVSEKSSYTFRTRTQPMNAGFP